MAEIDELANSLIEQAKRFLEKARDTSEPAGKQAYLNAALVLAFAALEAYVNSIAEDFATRTDFSEMERSILLERDVQFEHGKFFVTDKLKMYRMEDRIEFLLRKFGESPIDKTLAWWSGLKSGIKLRNKLVHPKSQPEINYANVANAVEAIINTINQLFQTIYKRPYPASTRGLESSLEF